MILFFFGLLISWCRGASIGWHSDDNRQYLKQRDFAVILQSTNAIFDMRFMYMTLVLVGLKAVCYLNSYGKEFKGGLFRFQSGEPETVAPSAGVSFSFL